MEFRFRNSSLVICPRIPWMISRVENPWGLQWWLPWDQRRWRTILRKTIRSLFWLFWLRKMPKNSQRSSLFSLENYHLPGVFVSIFFYFHPKPLGEDEPILTSIFFRWVGSTTNQSWPFLLGYITGMNTTQLYSDDHQPWKKGSRKFNQPVFQWKVRVFFIR